MARLPKTYNIGDRSDLSPEYLLYLIENLYLQVVQQLNRCPQVYFRDTDGLTTDYQLSNGDFNVNTSTNKVEMLVAHPTATTVTWVTLS